jgi:hypothetical protein
MEDIFAEADKAIDAKFGDQAEASSPSDQAPEAVPSKADQATESQESQGLSKSEAQALFDLSKAEKFTFKGKEMTLKDLESQMMMQSDYTKKMQEMSSFRKNAEFAMHWEADMPKLLDDPSLASEFYRAYPKAYHPLIERLVERSGQSYEQPSESSTPTQQELIEKIVEKRLGPIQSKLDEYETEAAIKQIDGIFSEMKGKFPHADEEFVLARLEALRGQGTQVNAQKIEEVFKHFHERDIKTKEAYHMEQLNKQKQANAKAKDVPSGGGIPGSAPKTHKIRSEADWSNLEKSAIEHLKTSQRLSQ